MIDYLTKRRLRADCLDYEQIFEVGSKKVIKKKQKQNCSEVKDEDKQMENPGQVSAS